MRGQLLYLLENTDVAMKKKKRSGKLETMRPLHKLKEDGKKYDQREGRDIQRDLKEKLMRTEKCLKEAEASTLQTLTCCLSCQGLPVSTVKTGLMLSLRTCQSLNVLWSHGNTTKIAQNLGVGVATRMSSSIQPSPNQRVTWEKRVSCASNDII